MKNKLKKPINKKIAGIIVIAAVAGGGYLVTTNAQRPNTENVFSEVFGTQVHNVTRSDLREVLTASGTVEISQERDIFATSTGVVAEILVQEGDYVEAGQEIIRYNIDTVLQELQDKLAEAEINLSNQQLSLASLLLPPTEDEIQRLNDSIASAERSVVNHNRTIEERERTVQDRVRLVEDAERAVEDAERAINDAQRNYEVALDDINNHQTTLDRLQRTVDDNIILLEVGAITEETHTRSVQDHEDSLLVLRNLERTLEDRATAIEEAQDRHLLAIRDVEVAQQNVDVAQQNVEAAREDLAVAIEDVSAAQRDLANAQILLRNEADRINVQRQENAIRSSELSIEQIQREIDALTPYVVSETSGIVTAINVSMMDKVSDGTKLMTISNFDNLILTSSISEYDAASLSIGQNVEMVSVGMNSIVYTGRIIRIDPIATQTSTQGGTEVVVSVDISIDNNDGVLKPGFSLDADIILVNVQDVVNVPVLAIQRDSETRESFVYVVDANNILEKRFVELGVNSDLNIEITSGLQEGETIVASPTPDMTDGMEIVIGEPPTMMTGGNAPNMMQSGPMMPMQGGGGQGRGNAVRIGG